tara:strand:+ start:5042 stop:5338 length:297 start_codon:yes stop_codon:yes gene_type:complete
MSYKVRVVYTKPNEGVSLHSPSTEYTNLINSYFDAGKITSKPSHVTSADGLTHTYTMVFNTEADFNDFGAESPALLNFETRENHCTSNSISYSLEQGV